MDGLFTKYGCGKAGLDSDLTIEMLNVERRAVVITPVTSPVDNFVSAALWPLGKGLG